LPIRTEFVRERYWKRFRRQPHAISTLFAAAIAACLAECFFDANLPIRNAMIDKAATGDGIDKSMKAVCLT